MQIELEIKEILNREGSMEHKVVVIRKLMNWDEKKLTEAILKHGTSSKEGRDAIIKSFWGKLRA